MSFSESTAAHEAYSWRWFGEIPSEFSILITTEHNKWKAAPLQSTKLQHHRSLLGQAGTSPTPFLDIHPLFNINLGGRRQISPMDVETESFFESVVNRWGMNPSWTGRDYCPQPTQSVLSVKVRSSLSPFCFDELLKLGISLNPEDTPINLFLIPSIQKIRLFLDSTDL
jgi:hypothetical protein